MTDEPILRVSLKEYKQEIDNLRTALQSLETTSEEYKKVAGEIKDMQDKLNDVMSAGKDEVDAVAKSYKALSDELSRLRQEFNEIEQGTVAWEEMASRIADVSSQLKTAGNEAGSFSTNVGDYANAFTAEFDKAVESIKEIESQLSSAIEKTKNLAPAAKTLNTDGIKEYKKEIENLRASLINLDSSSEEYKNVAQQVRDMQAKLSEVMAVGKRDAEAVAGSYNALSQEMSRLKKEWKTMEIGTEAWRDMAVRINGINDQLKDADAQVGVFTRNVGDYANAFSTALEKAFDGLGKVDGEIGAAAKTIKQLIPIIKQANSTAVKGLNGVKAALVSTGIGALIVAVGLLISNWDKLTKMFNKSRKENEKLIEANDALNTKFDEQDRLLENQVTIMQAQGKSTAEVNAEKNKLIETQLAETRATIQETKAKIAEIEAHSWFRRILTGEQSDLKGLKKTLEDLEKIEKKLSDSKDKNNASTSAYYETQKQKAKEAYEAEEEKVRELLKTIEDANKTEIQKLTDKYNEELKLLKKHHKSTKSLTEQYNKEVARLEKQAAKERQEAVNAAYNNVGNYNSSFSLQYELKSAQEQLDKFAKLTNKEFPPEGLLDAIIAGEDLTNIITNLVGDSVKLLEDAKAQELISTESIEEFVANWISAQERVKAAKKDIISYEAELIDAQVQLYKDYWQKRKEEGTDAVTAEIEFEYEKVLAQRKIFEEAAKSSSDETAAYYNLKMDELTKLADELLRRIAEREAELNILSAENRAQEANMNKNTSGFWNDTSFKKGYEARIEAARVYLEEVQQLEYDSVQERIAAELAAEQELYDIQREYNEMKLKNHLDFFNSMADIYGSIASILEQNIENEKKALVAQGKTDEEAENLLKDKFNAVKGFQIAQATINTISGAITAFMESQKLGQPWGTIIGAAQAAAVTAAGVAQIQKIASTQIGNASLPTAPNAAATPKIAEYQPQNVQNITTASDEERLQSLMEKTNIVVNVSDIDKAQKRVRVRQSESSF